MKFSHQMTTVTMCVLCFFKMAASCSCPSSEIRDTFCSSTFSAILTVTQRSPSCLEWHTCYQIEIKRRFKPEVGVVKEIISANHTAACGHQFQVGREYLVNGQLMDSSSSKAEVYSCSMPLLWSELTYGQKREYLTDMKPTEPCKRKRKRVL
ncbi:hypothetical protein HDE_02115 [Halotydeus destructor]|nr:hypothetical protein HDE_02115 [Halotydeus destructor]